MIDGLHLLFREQSPPVALALQNQLEELITQRGPHARLIRQETIKSQVHRLYFDLEGEPLTFILKCMEARIARRTELVVRRWLPAVGLTQGGSPLQASVGMPDEGSVWHIYSDLGSRSLAEEMDNLESVAAALRFIGELHARFIAHPYIPEVRLYGGELGAPFVESNLRDAMLCLEAIAKRTDIEADNRPVVEQLLDRISVIIGELPWRLKILKEFAGPETLLHGDLWMSNVFVSSEGHVRLIDWDRTGVGPVAYDVSTFLLRFPPPQRAELMDLYREGLPPGLWEIPSHKDLNMLFETFEFARYACLTIWPAIALWESGAFWALEQLEEIERWFQTWQPIFPALEDAA
jgi:hypothetical protein